VFQNVVIHRLHQVLDAFAAIQIRHGFAVAIAQKMHMTVKETRQHGFPFQIDRTVRLGNAGFYLFVAAHDSNDSIFHADGFCHGAGRIHRVDPAVSTYDFQMIAPFGSIQ